jgi:hypothetical protein
MVIAPVLGVAAEPSAESGVRSLQHEQWCGLLRMSSIMR